MIDIVAVVVVVVVVVAAAVVVAVVVVVVVVVVVIVVVIVVVVVVAVVVVVVAAAVVAVVVVVAVVAVARARARPRRARMRPGICTLCLRLIAHVTRDRGQHFVIQRVIGCSMIGHPSLLLHTVSHYHALCHTLLRMSRKPPHNCSNVITVIKHLFRHLPKIPSNSYHDIALIKQQILESISKQNQRSPKHLHTRLWRTLQPKLVTPSSSNTSKTQLI